MRKSIIIGLATEEPLPPMPTIPKRPGNCLYSCWLVGKQPETYECTILKRRYPKGDATCVLTKDRCRLYARI